MVGADAWDWVAAERERQGGKEDREKKKRRPASEILPWGSSAWMAARRGKPQPNGKERLGSGNKVLQSGKCDKRTTTTVYGDSFPD